jgi:UDP-N-acetylmuramate dehydrogenase
MTSIEKLINKLGVNRVSVNEPLAKYTYMKVGGPAEILFKANSSHELVEAVTAAQATLVPYTVIGNGANVLVSDKGIAGLTVINHSSNFKFLPHDYLETDSGVNVVELITQAGKRRLTGFERMMKVPATVGGAIFMNAGDTNRQEFFGDLVRSVRVLTPMGQVKTINSEDCHFTYRTSRFQESGEIILSAVLQLKSAAKEDIEEKVRDILVRKVNQPAGPSVGSTFRNPEGGFAGDLLEKAGVKGLASGGAKVSEKHANFILNLGNASASNIRELIQLMKRKVKENSGVSLEEEVRYLGDWKI